MAQRRIDEMARQFMLDTDVTDILADDPTIGRPGLAARARAVGAAPS
ncbi:MAG: hypothetical protein WCH74_12155 [Chloroflexota bacterium]